MPSLDPVQEAVRQSTARHKVLPWCRRGGKSHLECALALEAALEKQHGAAGVVWWVWPTHKMGRTGWKILRNVGGQIARRLGGRVYEVERAVTFGRGGGEIQMRSAEDPESLVAEGLTRVIIDEAGLVQSRAWYESLAAALMDKQGDAVFGGTPKGRGGLFWECAQNAEDEQIPDWEVWRRTIHDNPWVHPDEVARMEREYRSGRIPERIWHQEFLAEFVGDAGAVFRNVREAATAIPQEKAQDGHSYVFGVDWGKHEDFNAIAVLDLDEKAICSLDRTQHLDYAVQVGKLKAMADRFKPLEIVAEANAMGEPIIEQLEREGLPVQPFTTSNATKKAAVEALSLAFETGQIRIVPDEDLIRELQGYEMKRTATGLTKYEAPSGMHDDTVTACFLAWTAVEAGATVEVEWS